ncbi:hypothetical protein F0562_004195 [Nyssa sinensis]|uniref:Uncharacterized protein n=1 Tax=Nyssa sinensis TaxID=561372 RepID=A0A5J5BYP9_9ASTE|nr:hypothetical protein F0562_004195 [Nyssa sinensis]
MGGVCGGAKEVELYSNADGGGHCVAVPLKGCINDNGGAPWQTLALATSLTNVTGCCLLSFVLAAAVAHSLDYFLLMDLMECCDCHDLQTCFHSLNWTKSTFKKKMDDAP